MSRALPYLAAWFVPSTVLTLMYLVAGATPLAAVVGGVVGGFVGLLGAAMALLVRVLEACHRDRQLDEALAQLREMQDRPPRTHIDPDGSPRFFPLDPDDPPER